MLGAGLVITAAKCDRGETPEFGDLFAGFQSHFGKLATVGAIYLGGFIVIFLAAGVVSGVGIAALAQGGEGAAKAGGAVLLAVLIALALMVPLLMAVWFAAPLVLFLWRCCGAALCAVLLGSAQRCSQRVRCFVLAPLTACASTPLRSACRSWAGIGHGPYPQPVGFAYGLASTCAHSRAPGCSGCRSG